MKGAEIEPFGAAPDLAAAVLAGFSSPVSFPALLPDFMRPRPRAWLRAGGGSSVPRRPSSI